MSRTPSLRALFGLVAVGVVLGCQAIVGIDDRTVVPVETCDATCEACERFCDKAMANCSGDFAVYPARDTCIGVCNALPLGVDFNEPGNANTIACREHQADLALSTGEPDEHCNGVGPGGGNLCGSDCDSYCYLYPKVCPAQLSDESQCLDKCRALEDQPEYNVEEYYDSDSLECRLIHLGNATLDKVHCTHAKFQSALHCMPPITEAPDCMTYCRVVRVACSTPDRVVYDNQAECLATCAALDPGTNEDISENTVGCRIYHSYSAIYDPDTHCSHAGPGGAGHCGSLTEPAEGTCQSYCRLAAAACGTAFTAKYASEAACLTDCATLPGATDDTTTDGVNETEHYSVSLAEAPDALGYRCRLLHTTRALADPATVPTECPMALGVVPCP